MNRIGLSILVIVCSSGVAAQQPRPTFEIASVKPQARPTTSAEAAGWPRVRPGGRLIGSHTTVEWLITFAYDLKSFQVIGGPDWIRNDFFEVNAQAGADVPVGQLRLMMQSLLEERFKLAVRMEQREMQYQALILARADRQPGPDLRRLEDGACEGKSVGEVHREAFPDAPARNRIAGACVELRDLAQVVSMQLDTLVIDRTGLAGQWVYEAPYSGQPPRLASARLGAPLPVDPGSAVPGVPPYSVALEEHLGLKVEPARGPVDVLVIDSVQQPTEN